MKRRFLVHCWWNGYTQTHEISLFEDEKANVETFIPEVRRLNDDNFGLETRIYSWSLIED